MATNAVDKEQIEMLKEWWQNWGKYLALAILVGLVLGYGWRWYRQHNIKQANQASMMFQVMMKADSENQVKISQQYAKDLMQHYSKTPYATMAALLWAREAVAKKQYDDAFLKLQWAYQNSNVASFRQIARLRAARILLAQKQYQKALQILKKVDEKTYLPVIENTKGDIYIAEGKPKEARIAYQKAKIGFVALGAMDPLLQIKLNSPL